MVCAFLLHLDRYGYAFAHGLVIGAARAYLDLHLVGTLLQALFHGDLSGRAADRDLFVSAEFLKSPGALALVLKGKTFGNGQCHLCLFQLAVTDRGCFSLDVQAVGSLIDREILVQGADIQTPAGDDHAVSTGIERVYTVRHTVCGTEISGTVRQFIGTKYIRPKRCTLCFKYEEGTRTLQKSDAGKAIEDMTAWFKEHRIWTLKQHRKIGHNTLKKLCGAGLIYHVGFGMYSSVRDIDIYELLEERYLKNDEGNTIGRFTGKTSAFLAGMIDEPEIITLETSSVRRLDNHLYTICGRSVSVRGIKSSHAKGDD